MSAAFVDERAMRARKVHASERQSIAANPRAESTLKKMENDTRRC